MAVAAARECLGGEPALHLSKFVTVSHLAHTIVKRAYITLGTLVRKGQVPDYTQS